MVRFRVSPELGKYVFHCHILEHEDGGMMMAILALPNPSQRRVALGTSSGERATVLVRDGNGRPQGRIRPGPRDKKGGLATATGILSNDDTEDVVVARRAFPHSPAYVSVYNGMNLRRIHRFEPFPDFHRGGVSVAAGDINGDGRAEIIAGRLGPGASLVRVFRPDGTRVRQIKGTIPGRLPHGVTVTSADLNGDNFDDLAIGAARGRAPRVVALDGSTLGDTSRPPKTLFSFRADDGNKSGVNLASGYYDPRTRPGLLANLITTPQKGPHAGRVRVWTPQFVEQHGASESTSTMPQLMASFRPFGGHTHGGLRLAVTRLGPQGVDALATWRNPRKPKYVSISNDGVISYVPTPVTNGTGVLRQRVPRGAAVPVSLRGGPLWVCHYTRHGLVLTRTPAKGFPARSSG